MHYLYLGPGSGSGSARECAGSGERRRRGLLVWNELEENEKFGVAMATQTVIISHDTALLPLIEYCKLDH